MIAYSWTIASGGVSPSVSPGRLHRQSFMHTVATVLASGLGMVMRLWLTQEWVRIKLYAPSCQTAAFFFPSSSSRRSRGKKGSCSTWQSGKCASERERRAKRAGLRSEGRFQPKGSKQMAAGLRLLKLRRALPPCAKKNPLPPSSTLLSSDKKPLPADSSVPPENSLSPHSDETHR